MFASLVWMSCLVALSTSGVASSYISLDERVNQIIRDRPACPCDDARLCLPVQGKRQLEVYVFAHDRSPVNWRFYDWSRISTVSIFSTSWDPQMMCFAHARGVRVVRKTIEFLPEQLLNDTMKEEWAIRELAYILHNYLDGVNIDFEYSIAKDSKQVAALTEWTRYLTEMIRFYVPNSQISMDVPYAPYIWGRNYDVASLSNITDFLVIMAYDMYGSEPSANCPIKKVLKGIDSFVQYNVPSDKLVVGFPWYGIDYPLPASPSRAARHRIRARSVHSMLDARISDAAWRSNKYSKGTAIRYTDITYKLLPLAHNGTKWDESTWTRYFSYFNPGDGCKHTVWYDDPHSLDLKQHAVLEKGVRGVGVWQTDFGDQDMWASLPWSV